MPEKKYVLVDGESVLKRNLAPEVFETKEAQTALRFRTNKRGEVLPERAGRKPKRMPKYTKFGTKAGPRKGFKEWFGTKIAAGLSGTEVANRMRMIRQGKGKQLPKKGFGGMPMPKGTSEDKYGESLSKSLLRKQKSDRSGRRSKDLLYPGP